MGNQHMRITVMGGGAIGKLTAAKLIRTGFDVTLLVRREAQAESLRKNGLVLIRSDGVRSALPVTAATSFSFPLPDLVILTVKSFDTGAAARQIAASCQSVPVLSLQNGLGNGETLAGILGEENVLLGVTTYGATSVSDCEVAERGEGELALGGYRTSNSMVDKLLGILSKAEWNVRTANNMEKEIWMKALVNIGINPVTAIHRVCNGEILERAPLRELAVAAVREAGAVAAAIGVLTPEEAAEGIGRMLTVCRQTALNRSSMLQDVENRRRTEIDSLNGAVVRWGEQLSIDTPVNRELTSQIQSMQML